MKWKWIWLVILISIFLGSKIVLSNVWISSRQLGLPNFRVPRWDSNLADWKYRIGIRFMNNQSTNLTNFTVSRTLDFIQLLDDAGVISHGEKVLNTTGLVAWWKFENLNGTNYTYDSVGNNHGKVYGATFVGSGRIGHGFEFDGVDDYITADSVTADLENKNMTALFWMKSSEVSGTSFFISFHDNSGSNKLLIGHNLNNKLSIHNGASWAGTSSVPVIDNTWHFIAVVFDTSADNIDVYIDGNYDFSTSCSNDFVSTDRFTIGMEWDASTPSDFYEGLIDEILIFNRLLSAEEIQAYYNFTKAQHFWDNQSIRISEHYMWGGGLKQSDVKFVVKNRNEIQIGG